MSGRNNLVAVSENTSSILARKQNYERKARHKLKKEQQQQQQYKQINNG